MSFGPQDDRIVEKSVLPGHVWALKINQYIE